MSVYKLFDRHANMNPTYGSGSREAMLDISAHRLDQEIFPSDHGRLDHFEDGASSYITSNNISTRLARDLTIDANNPRQELPKQPTDKLIDTISNLTERMPDMSMPEDYQASTAAGMYKEAKKHYRAQDNLFVSGKGDTSLIDGDLMGVAKPTRTLDQAEFYSHEARTNRLQTDEDGTYMNSIESAHAF